MKVSTKTSNQTDDYLVTVTVTNNTGGSIYEKVQGGLAAGQVCYADSNGKCYNPVSNVITIPSAGYASDITTNCGKAAIAVSSAKTNSGNSGNVVVWGDGTTATNQKGFPMSQGQVCQLKVIVRKPFSSTGSQPVTSSWSEQQTGPGSYVGKSPYTGNLLVTVKP